MTLDFGVLDAGKDTCVLLLCIHKGQVGGFDFISHLDILMPEAFLNDSFDCQMAKFVVKEFPWCGI
jgi:hypothetical protein